MGGILGHCVAGVDLLRMIRLLVCWLLLVASGIASAAGYATATVGGGALKSGSTWAVSGATATAANGAFITPATVTAAGKVVTMPASASIAANAAQVAISAVRLNPTALAVGVVAPWLLTKGLEYINGQWKMTPTGGYATGMQWQLNGNGVQYSTPEAACAVAGSGYFLNKVISGGRPYYQCWFTAGANQYFSGSNASPSCTSGTYSWANGVDTCGLPVTKVAATDADFTAAGSGALPSDVAQELARNGVPIPVNPPVLDPTPRVENYGNPFVDPTTGKTVQTKTRITPDPTPDDPNRVRVESYNVEVAPAPVPVAGDPVPVPQAEQPKDPCLDNPDRMGCLNSGTPDDVPLGTYAVPFAVTPVSVGGAGACPPDSVLRVHGGLAVTMKMAPICDAAAWLKPLVLAMAWFGAAMIIAGAVRES